MPFGARPAQTRIKHAIVTEYVGAWAGIISTGLRPRTGQRQFTTEFVYADGYAGYGQYSFDKANPAAGAVWGSPILALRALIGASSDMRSNGLQPNVTGILVEKDQEKFRELCSHLQAQFPEVDLHTPRSSSDISLGTNSAIKGDFREEGGKIVEAIPEKAFLLTFVDPFGTSAHFDAIVPLLERHKTDLILYFPSQQILKYGGAINKPNPSETDINNMGRVNAVFGCDYWREIARRSDLTSGVRIELYAKLYQSRLRSVRRSPWVKTIPLRFSGSNLNTPGYHLVLVTDHPDGAMRMNDILRKAEVREHVELLQDKEQEIREAANLELFAADYASEVPEEEITFETGEIVAAIERALSQQAGRKITWKNLKGCLANELYREHEIRRGLKQLKGSRVAYEKRLTNKTSIQILS